MRRKHYIKPVGAVRSSSSESKTGIPRKTPIHQGRRVVSSQPTINKADNDEFESNVQALPAIDTRKMHALHNNMVVVSLNKHAHQNRGTNVPTQPTVPPMPKKKPSNIKVKSFSVKKDPNNKKKK